MYVSNVTAQSRSNFLCAMCHVHFDVMFCSCLYLWFVGLGVGFGISLVDARQFKTVKKLRIFLCLLSEWCSLSPSSLNSKCAVISVVNL